MNKDEAKIYSMTVYMIDGFSRGYGNLSYDDIQDLEKNINLKSFVKMGLELINTSNIVLINIQKPDLEIDNS